MSLLAPESRSTDLDLLLSALPAGWEDMMCERGLISSHRDTKLRTPADIMRLVLLHVGCNLPLRQTVEWAHAAGLPSCSHVALHDKMRRLTDFVVEMVGRMSDGLEATSVESWGGYELVALDGSIVVTPGPSSAGGRLHVALRLSDLGVVGAQVTTTEGGETLRRFTFTQDQLVIADRGYANPPGLLHVADQGAEILVRVNRGALPLYETSTGKALSVLSWVRTLTGRRAHERSVFVRADDGRQLVGRLIAQRLPADKIQAARQRVRREVGEDEAALEMAEWVVLFTTASTKRLTTAQATAAYRLRWQVELLFKRWKSLCRLDMLPNYRNDTLVTWLAAKLLLILCADKLSSAATTRGFPPLTTEHFSIDRKAHRVASPAMEIAHHVVADSMRHASADLAVISA